MSSVPKKSIEVRMKIAELGSCLDCGLGARLHDVCDPFWRSFQLFYRIDRVIRK